MSSDWREMSIADAVEINPTIKLQKGQAYQFVEMADLDENITRVCSVNDRIFKGSGSKFMPGDTLFARITPCLENGKVALFISDRNEPSFGSTEFIVIRGRDGITTDKYSHYLATDPNFRSFAISKMTGSSGRQRVPVDELARYTICIPPIQIQHSITKILGDLDEKISLLMRMNYTLEKILRAVFKEWFVDFKPVRAKAEGATNFGGLPQELFDSLPDTFSASEIGEIPVGWTTAPLIEQAEWVNGAAYKNMHFSAKDDALPVIKIAELKKGITTNTKFTCTDLGDKYRLYSGDLTFSWSGSPETSIDTFIWALGDAWLNQHIFVVHPNRGKCRGYLFALLKNLKPTLVAIAKDKQTTGLGHVTRADMTRLHVVEPNGPIFEWYSDFADNIYQKILSNLVEGQELTNIRNTLLPKLISGELPAPSLQNLGLAEESDGG